MTNFERIQSMTIEELAILIARPLCQKCAWCGKCMNNSEMNCDGDGTLAWLKQEVYEDEQKR